MPWRPRRIPRIHRTRSPSAASGGDGCWHRARLPEEDQQVNALGIKGLGELGNVETNAAIANAVHHATGIRVRELPIRLEKLLQPMPVLGENS